MNYIKETAEITTIRGLNYYIKDNLVQEARECVKYFKPFVKDPTRRRRREEAYEGWPLTNEKQVQYVLSKLPELKVKESHGIYLIMLDR